ncbi:hypothetical protein lerEdw1_005660 [Lerista edwardsae]|nr:hypothetical protein lerEdw1_005660 [Lerista edwardsae]
MGLTRRRHRYQRTAKKKQKDSDGFVASSGLGPPALRRALYVFAGLCVIAALYYLGGRFLRKRKPPRKKYGLLSNSEDNVEMASLESDEDTLFESRNMRRWVLSFSYDDGTNGATVQTRPEKVPICYREPLSFIPGF